MARQGKKNKTLNSADNMNLEYPLSPLNEKQKKLIDSLSKKRVIFSTGPAGTGKTYIAALHAAWLLRTNQISKIIITRPTVAVERTIGYVPGNINEKMLQWVAPVTSVIDSYIPNGVYSKIPKEELIEILPLEYVRGRTFTDCFVILDEAQNCTYSEIKAFLTRIGDNCTCYIDGDESQSDIKKHKLVSGLDHIIHLIGENPIKDVEHIHFSSNDIVRSGIVKDFILAFDKYEKRHFEKFL